MSKLVKDLNDTYGDSHDWVDGESHQWGMYGGRARTPWSCKACGVYFNHYYHDVVNIRQAMRDVNIPDLCPALKPEENNHV